MSGIRRLLAFTIALLASVSILVTVPAMAAPEPYLDIHQDLPLVPGADLRLTVDVLPAACHNPGNWPATIKVTLLGQTLPLRTVTVEIYQSGEVTYARLTVPTTVPRLGAAKADLVFACNATGAFVSTSLAVRRGHRSLIEIGMVERISVATTATLHRGSEFSEHLADLVVPRAYA